MTARRTAGARLALPTTRDPILLRVDGPPTGKGRPRFDGRARAKRDGTLQRGRTFTPQATIDAEERIRRAWALAGRPRLPDEPLSLALEIVVERPDSHWRRDGTLGAVGQRSSWPTTKPDLDNVLKLVADALNEHAYRDDAYIVEARAVRRWANAGEGEYTIVRLELAAVPGAVGITTLAGAR